MRINQDFINSVMATVFGGLLLSAVLWCFHRYSELPFSWAEFMTWGDKSQSLLLLIILVGLLSLRLTLRPTLRSRMSKFTYKVFQLFHSR